MFCENLKNIRRAKGISQELLAEQLHVVRQTVSKWENGFSVPDADALIRLAEFFETSVSALLGGPMEAPETIDLVAQKLEQLNRQLADKNRRSRRVWRAAAGILVFLALCGTLQLFLNFSD